jgi:hypothetical protein
MSDAAWIQFARRLGRVCKNLRGIDQWPAAVCPPHAGIRPPDCGGITTSLRGFSHSIRFYRFSQVRDKKLCRPWRAGSRAASLSLLAGPLRGRKPCGSRRSVPRQRAYRFVCRRRRGGPAGTQRRHVSAGHPRPGGGDALRSRPKNDRQKSAVPGEWPGGVLRAEAAGLLWLPPIPCAILCAANGS